MCYKMKSVTFLNKRRWRDYEIVFICHDEGGKSYSWGYTHTQTKILFPFSLLACIFILLFYLNLLIKILPKKEFIYLGHFASATILVNSNLSGIIFCSKTENLFYTFILSSPMFFVLGLFTAWMWFRAPEISRIKSK